MTPTTTKSKNKIEHKGQLVNTEHVDNLISTYKKERWIQNSERLGKNDSLSTWYGLSELEAFIQKAKDHNADGIKIYFGVYPNDFEVVSEFQGRQTVVLVASKKKISESGTFNKDIYIVKNNISEILAFNYGDMCPPFCNHSNGTSIINQIQIDTEKTGITLIESKKGILII